MDGEERGVRTGDNKVSTGYIFIYFFFLPPPLKLVSCQSCGMVL